MWERSPRQYVVWEASETRRRCQCHPWVWIRDTYGGCECAPHVDRRLFPCELRFPARWADAVRFFCLCYAHDSVSPAAWYWLLGRMLHHDDLCRSPFVLTVSALNSCTQRDAAR